MTKPIRSLANFKRLAKPGAKFLRSFPGQTIRPRIVTVAYAQSNAIVFPANGSDPASETLAIIAANPQRHGSWSYFPKAKNCRFENDEMTVLDNEGRPLIAFKPMAADETISNNGDTHA